MKPLDERLNARLEQAKWKSRQNELHPSGFMLPESLHEYDPDIDELAALAQRIQVAQQIQVAPTFSSQLERRLLRRHAELQIKQTQKKQAFFTLLRARPVLSVAVGLVLLFLILTTSTLALAAQTTDPSNPLNALKHWEQHLQASLTGNAGSEATLDLQSARDRLHTLANLADAPHEGEYRQALNDLNEQLNTAATAINALPIGSQRTQLEGELASLKGEAIQVLRGLLSRLTLSERLATTAELARLGDTVPVLTQATLTLPDHPNGSATVSFTGHDLQLGAQLLVDGKVIEEAGSVRNGQVVFVVKWHGDQHPSSLGILNPDGTATQISVITINGSSTNGNGNGNKPSVTPTPHGNKPSATPTPHH